MMKHGYSLVVLVAPRRGTLTIQGLVALSRGTKINQGLVAPLTPLLLPPSTPSAIPLPRLENGDPPYNLILN